jgi:AraC family transcriptional regulator
VPEFEAMPMLTTQTVAVWNVMCPGRIRHMADEECATSTHLIFPYRGVYVHHVGRTGFVVEANQVLFVNANEPYKVSHPVNGGDSTVSVRIEPETLLELMAAECRHPKGAAAFDRAGVRVDAHTQRMVATLRQRLRHGTVDALEGEELTLDLVRHTLDVKKWNPTHGNGAGPRRLTDKVKMLLSSDLSRRWTLSEAAQSVGVSPVYLTQAFKRVEDMPLYRYHLRLRLARALDLLADCDDLTTLALDLGFTSHSHFTAAFKKVYDITPSTFQHSVVTR